MALTKNDLEKVKGAVNEVTEPKFKEIEARFKVDIKNATEPYFIAIKQDFNDLDKKLVTKDYLDEKLENFVTKDYLHQEFQQFKGEFKEETMGEVDKLLTKADAIIKRLDDRETEEAAGLEAYKRHDKKIEEHEGRIASLEAKI